MVEEKGTGGTDDSAGLATKTDSNSHGKGKVNGIVPMTLQGQGNTIVIVSTVLWFVASHLYQKDFTTFVEPLIVHFDVEEIRTALKTIQDMARGIMADNADDIKAIGGNLRKPDRMFNKIHELMHKCSFD